MKKILIRLFIPVLAVIILLSGTLTVSAANSSWNPYPYGTCTWYTWRTAIEISGVTMPGLGDAKNWYANAASAGYSVGTVPKANSVVVFRDIGSATSGYGHVAYVRSVNGKTMNITEGSYKGRYIHEDTISPYAVRWTGGYRQAIIGYVYITKKALVVPKVMEVSSLSLMNNEMKLSWQAVKGATGYEIFRWNANNKEFKKVKDTAETSFNDTKLEKEKTYVYKVRAYTIANGIHIIGSASEKLECNTKNVTPTSLKTQDKRITANKSTFKLFSISIGSIF